MRRAGSKSGQHPTDASASPNTEHTVSDEIRLDSAPKCWRCSARPATDSDGLCDSCFSSMEIGLAYAEHPEAWAFIEDDVQRRELQQLARFALGKRRTNPQPLPRFLESDPFTREQDE